MFYSTRNCVLLWNSIKLVIYCVQFSLHLDKVVQLVNLGANRSIDLFEAGCLARPCTFIARDDHFLECCFCFAFVVWHGKSDTFSKIFCRDVGGGEVFVREGPAKMDEKRESRLGFGNMQ